MRGPGFDHQYQKQKKSAVEAGKPKGLVLARAFLVQCNVVNGNTAQLCQGQSPHPLKPLMPS
jgi:hypothetical protein